MFYSIKLIFFFAVFVITTIIFSVAVGAIITRAKIVLENMIVSLKVYNPSLLTVKDWFNLILAHGMSAIIMH